MAFAATNVMRWLRETRPVLEPDRPLDDAKVLCPWVLPLPGGFRLFYMGHGSASAPGAFGRILSAWSDDGVTFRKEPGVRVDNGKGAEARALSPCVVARAGGGYRMYFEAAASAGGEGSVILSARSEDGLGFVREPGIRVRGDGARVGSPRVLPLDADYMRLYFHRYPEPIEERLDRGNHVVSALSTDGLTFELEPGVRIPQTHPRERAAVYCASMVALGEGRVRAYYGAWSGDASGRGAVMTALSQDAGQTFVKDEAPCIAPDSALDASFASEPCVFRDRDGRQRMVYEACDAAGKTRILAAIAAIAAET